MACYGTSLPSVKPAPFKPSMHEFDLRGFRCPLPVLKLRVRLKGLAPGERATVLTDDPLAAIDVPHFCAEAGQVLVESAETTDGHRFVVERGGDL